VVVAEVVQILEADVPTLDMTGLNRGRRYPAVDLAVRVACTRTEEERALRRDDAEHQFLARLKTAEVDGADVVVDTDEGLVDQVLVGVGVREEQVDLVIEARVRRQDIDRDVAAGREDRTTPAENGRCLGQAAA